MTVAFVSSWNVMSADGTEPPASDCVNPWTSTNGTLMSCVASVVAIDTVATEVVRPAVATVAM